MALWQRIKGLWKQKAIEIELPLTVNVVPNELSTKLYAHDLSGRTVGMGLDSTPVPCWTFVTEGLWPLGQKEIILTLRRGGEPSLEGVLKGLFTYLKIIYDLSRQKQLVDVGGRSWFRDLGFLGFPDCTGIIYVRPVPLEEVTLPTSPHIAALILTRDEFSVADELGHARILARLGEKYRYYPYPPWSDRERLSVTSMDEMEGSLLAKMPRMSQSGAHAYKRGDRIVLELLPSAGRAIHKEISQMPSGSYAAVLTSVDPAANACLVYLPGRAGHHAISPAGSDGSRMSGCYIAFGRGQDQDDGLIFEDGFIIEMTESTWNTFMQALDLNAPLVVESGPSGEGFELDWIRQDYWNPIDKRVYHAEEGWHVYRPRDGRDQAGGGACRVVLLTPQDVIAERAGLSALSNYISALERTVLEQFANELVPSNINLVVDSDLLPECPPKIQIADRSGRADDVVQRVGDRLVRALQAVSPPEVRGQIHFQLLVELPGAAGDPYLVH